MIKALLFDLGGTIVVEEPDKHLADMTMRLVPGVEEFIRKAYTQYVLMIVSNTVSSYAADIARLLDTVGLASGFKDIVTSLDYGAEKPDPSIFQFACERLGVKPEEALMIGDRVDKDIRGAKRAGLRAVLLRRERQDPVVHETPFDEPDFIAGSYAEIEAFLDRLRAKEAQRVS